jgi:hypothetical protein
MSNVEELRAQNAEPLARIEALEQQTSIIRPPAPPPKANGALTQRLDHRYWSHKSALEGRLRDVVMDRWSALANGDNLRLSQYSTAEDLTVTLPRAIAAELTREAAVRDDLKSAERGASLTGVPNTAKLQRLEVELAAVSAHTTDLIASTRLPPLPDALAAKLAELSKPAFRNPYGEHR